MRWTRFAPLVLAIAGVFAATGEAQARYHGDLNLFVGELWLYSSDWSPVDEQPELGLMLNFGEERAPIHFAIDLFASSKTASTTDPVASPIVKGASHEIAVGVRKVWAEHATRPHLGAGATAIAVSEDRNGPFGVENNEDRAYGAWVDLGVSWRLATHLNLGLETRYSWAPATVGAGANARDVNVGGIHLGLLVGFGW
jgi:hypothetical protein